MPKIQQPGCISPFAFSLEDMSAIKRSSGVRWPRILRIFTRHVCIYRYIYIYTRSLNESEYRSGIAALETRVTKSEIQYRGCVFPLFSVHSLFSPFFSLPPLSSISILFFFLFFYMYSFIYIYINSTNNRI